MENSRTVFLIVFLLVLPERCSLSRRHWRWLPGRVVTPTPASLFRLRLLPLPHGPCALRRHPVYRCPGYCGRMLRWAITCLTAPLGVSLLKVWGQGRHGLLEHFAEY